MTTFIPLSSRHSVEQLRQALAKASDEKHRTRIRAIINIKEGATRTEIQRRFVISNKTVVAWVKAYNEGGISALDMSKGGRPEGNPIWDTTIFDELVKEIDKGGYWSVPRMQKWIKEHHKEDIPESTVWYHVTNLGYSHKSARPHPYKGDKAKQDAFKKGVS